MHPVSGLSLLLGTTGSIAMQPEQIDVFVSGQEDYHTFRIPAVIVTPRGTLLAFCDCLLYTSPSPRD